MRSLIKSIQKNAETFGYYFLAYLGIYYILPLIFTEFQPVKFLPLYLLVNGTISTILSIVGIILFDQIIEYYWPEPKEGENNGQEQYDEPDEIYDDVFWFFYRLIALIEILAVGLFTYIGTLKLSPFIELHWTPLIIIFIIIMGAPSLIDTYAYNKPIE